MNQLESNWFHVWPAEFGLIRRRKWQEDGKFALNKNHVVKTTATIVFFQTLNWWWWYWFCSRKALMESTAASQKWTLRAQLVVNFQLPVAVAQSPAVLLLPLSHRSPPNPLSSLILLQMAPSQLSPAPLRMLLELPFADLPAPWSTWLGARGGVEMEGPAPRPTSPPLTCWKATDPTINENRSKDVLLIFVCT